MQIEQLLSSSPTLLQKELSIRELAFTKCAKLFRTKQPEKTKLTICVNYPEGIDVILLSELPAEIQQGFHDYSTRIKGEMYHIEAAILKQKTAS